MITVYYKETSCPASDYPLLIVTDKGYWDANRYLDDGAGPNYDAIADAMYDIGAPDFAESVYEFPTHDDLVRAVNAMREKGFAMVPNPELGFC